MGKIAIEFQNISKQYALGSIGTGTLSRDLNRWWARIRGKEDPYLRIGEENDRSKKATGDFVWALKDINFHVEEGEVLGIIGKNGAGKSTLMKILTGIYQADAGKIVFNGRETKINSVLDAKALGITMIHQELNLLSNLTIAQNIFISKEIKRHGVFLDERATSAMAAELLERVNLHVDPNTMVSELTVAQQQMVEIAKAISYNSRVIIMDEPTAPLSNSEIESLFAIIGEMKKSGISIIYISHRMDEIKRICDRATILRDGQYISTVDVASTSLDDIIAAMVGRKIAYVRKGRDKSRILEDEILRVEHLNSGSKVKDVSFSLRKGEILGFAGLVGAGRTETARLIFGADLPDGGEIYIGGKKVLIKSPYDAVRCGISYLSEDRKHFGLITEMSVENNITIASIPRLCKAFGYIDKAKCRNEAKKYTERLKVKAPSLDALVRSLSGGNQQKIVVAKWLLRNTDVLIFDEPTRGIDIGAKDEICELLISLADMGKAVIMISSEMQEILRVCDRILVMHEGEIAGELDADSATQEDIMRLASKYDMQAE